MSATTDTEPKNEKEPASTQATEEGSNSHEAPESGNGKTPAGDEGQTKTEEEGHIEIETEEGTKHTIEGEEGEYQDEDEEEFDDEEVHYIDDDEGDEDQDQDLSAKLSELRGMMGNFYPFGTQNQYTSVDLVLSKEEFELEELLELDDFLPDLRRGKSNLLSYLVQPEVLEQLIAYISTEPKEEEDEAEQEKMKRFAHLAYEAIQSDILKEAMINDHNMLDKFFDFLDITSEMDPLRCAYFSRIVELLFERYPKELISYLRKKNCIVAKFVWHINNQYIVESLFRLIDSQISHQWLHDEDLIPLLMFKMAECEDPETQEKTASTFVEILDLFVPFPYSILTTQMFHSEIVAEHWEQFTLSEATNYNKIQNGLNVAIGILNLSYEGNMADETPVFMKTVINRLDFFLDLLKKPQDASKTFQMTFGALTPPFGFLRVKVLEFLSALLNTRYQSVVDALWKTEPNIFSTLLDILFFYKWNNTLHYYIDQIIATIMSLDNGENIISVLIEKCRLIDRFIAAFKNENDRVAGYMGHLVHLCNELIKASTYHEPLFKLLSEHAGWKELVDGKLKEINDMNNTPIGAPPPAGGGGVGMQEEGMGLGMAAGMGMGNSGAMHSGSEEFMYEEQGVQYEDDDDPDAGSEGSGDDQPESAEDNSPSPAGEVPAVTQAGAAEEGQGKSADPAEGSQAS